MVRQLSDWLRELHHAYLLPGARVAYSTALDHALTTEGIELQGNPDVWRFTFETLTVDDARHIREAAFSRALGERKYFIMSFNSITVEAQNALLKVLEEPPPRTHFFLITTSEELLLPTVRSRLCVLPRVEEMAGVGVVDGAEFLASSRAARLVEVGRVIGRKDRAEMARWLRALEQALHNAFMRAPGNQELARGLREVSRAERYLESRSPSVKLILEHLALTLPTVL